MGVTSFWHVKGELFLYLQEALVGMLLYQISSVYH